MADQFRYGSSPPRSLETFGVAGVLDDTAQVYCETLFGVTQVGRVSDLISAQLRKLGVSELRLRALLLFAMFQGYVSQRTAHKPTLDEPLVVECGCDKEKVVVGISMTYPTEMGVSLDGIVDRVKNGEPAGIFDHILAEIYRNSDAVLIRLQRSIRRLEVVSFLGQPEKVPEGEYTDLVMIEIHAKTDVEPPSAIYSELADLDYTKLLADEGKGRLPDAPSSGVVLEKGFQELEEALKQRALARANSSLEVGSDQLVKVSLDAPSSDSDQTLVLELRRRINELEARLAGVSTTPTTPSAPIEDDPDAETVTELAGKTLRGLFGKVRELRGIPAPPEDEGDTVIKAAPLEEERISVVKSDPVDEDGNESVFIAGSKSDGGSGNSLKMLEMPDIPDVPVSEDDVSGNFLVELQQGSLERTIARAQKESDEVRKEISSTRAKRWVDGLMTELMEEKARLQEFAKKVNQTVKQREFEFQKRESAYSEAIKKRDGLLRQKNAALSRAKDQVTHLSQALDKAKIGSSGAREDSHMKQKYEMAQRLVNVHKEENSQLQKRVEDLTVKLTALQSGLKARGAAESIEIRDKCDRLTRQVDELKRANQGLLEKVAEVASKGGRPGSLGSAASNEELRKKLEAAMRVAAQHQKDAEMKQLRVEELDREAIRLQKELEQALALIKSLRGEAA